MSKSNNIFSNSVDLAKVLLHKLQNFLNNLTKFF